ncbi:acyltransferase [Sinorhizobium meliloti]|uniref:acyltransferase n=1 Tax=Rhizobium meliloti TaxID=382 RepID=UPI0009B7E481|nr:acyltransferase [Sinorhizobium meliloti]
MRKPSTRSKGHVTLEPLYLSEKEILGGFEAVGKDVKISETCTIAGAANISIGDNVTIDAGVFIDCQSGSITIGNHVHIAPGCYLSGGGTIALEDFSGLAPGACIFSGSDDYVGEGLTNATVPEEFRRVTYAPVRLGRHVIIGSGTVVLPGCSIGEGSSVGALSLVTKDLDSWGVFCGVPAKRLKNRSRKLLDLERQLGHIDTG